MKKNLLLTLAAFAISSGYAQSDKFWSSYKGESNRLTTDKSVTRLSFPKQFDLYELNMTQIKQTLLATQNRLPNQKVIITLPNANGGLEEFEMFEASNFEADLQAQYPEIRAYSGKGITDKYASLKLSISPQGIQTMVFRADRPNEFIEPYSQDHRVYAVFKSQREKGQMPWTCSVQDNEMFAEITPKAQSLAGKFSDGKMRTMRLAQSVTAEYSNYFGATSAAQSGLVLAAINATLTRCNGVYEKDLGLHLNLVAASTNVFYYNPATDPYSAAATGSGGAWNTELQNTLSTSLTGPATSLAANNAAYDIGHLFGASGGGGNAGCIGCVCVDDSASTADKNKGSGFTSPGDGVPAGDNFDIDYVVHEVGHQLGANHTFSHANEGSGVNMEVGSGVTIMGYAGITPQDVAPHSIDVYHAASIAQIQTNLAGKTCPTSTNITNATPVANAGADYTIPKSTPFMLTGAATDANAGDALTYMWEQYNNASGAQTGANSAASATKSTGPNWRDYAQSSSPKRYFPTMTSVLNGQTTTAGAEITAEALSSVARTLTFRLTVRDNAPFISTVPVSVAQTNFDDMVVTVDATRGPLTVTSQNTDGIVWAHGSSQTITWAVNSTNTSAGGTNVDILLSTDNGATFNTVLLANTPNDGSQAITVPTVTAANCRVMVKASGNIFFNVNSKNIAVGNYTYQPQNVCSDYTFNINSAITESTTSYSGFSLPITDSFTVTDVNAEINATHPNIGTIQFAISSPTGYAVTPTPVLSRLYRANGNSCASGVNLRKTFDMAGSAINCANTTDNAITLPSDDIGTANYVGTNSQGNWYIWMVDLNTTDGLTGMLNTFRLNLCHSEMVPVLATESFGLENFSIYPNPNNGNFNVQFTSNSSNEIKIGVHDLRGRLVFDKSFQNTGTIQQNVALKNVQSGIYIVTVQDGDRKETKKIVIE